MNRITDYSKLADDITNWIRDYATTNNIKSLVVGVSGGIDSAVVSTLCARTGLDVYCSTIDIHSNPEHIRMASNHISWLMITSNSTVYYKHFNLSNTLQSLMGDIDRTDYTTHAIANTKSRLRMTVLYETANSIHGLVIGTGNKVEDFGVGFFTRGGDGCVDISPIADLYKTEVRELGRYLGISQEILDAAPTDGLWGENQKTDEQVLGATYEELEWAMENIGTYDDDQITMFYTSRQMEVLEIYGLLHVKNQHKMLPIPIFKLNQ